MDNTLNHDPLVHYNNICDEKEGPINVLNVMGQSLAGAETLRTGYSDDKL